nr:hypothetical protein [Brucella intermedia]
MATLSDYTSGTISLANGSVTVTGTGTLFEVTRFREGDTLQIQNLTAVIASVDSDTQLTLTEPWTGTTIVDGPYRARQLGDGSRVSTQAATVIELLGNGVLTNLAELGVEEGKVPVGGPTGEYELVDTSTFGIQDPNGSLGKLAALELDARQILQTDAAGDLKQIALAANKLLRTDANADITQSDITAAAIALLNLTGTAVADCLPYLTGESGAGLTTLTAFARTILDDASGAAMWATMGASSNSNRVILPDGRVFMMGTAAAPATGYGPVTFPTSFPNNCFGVVSSLNANVSSSYTRTITTFGHNQSGFSVVIQAILNGGTLQFDPGILFNYFAWGN